MSKTEKQTNKPNLLACAVDFWDPFWARKAKEEGGRGEREFKR